MVEKKKILKQLVFFVCILIASSSIVNAQTTKARCPAGTALVSGTSKCCPSYNVNGKSIKATKTTNKNQCVYDLTGKGVYINKHVPGTDIYCVSNRSKDGCVGKSAQNMIESKTYTTTVYFQHSWGGGYKTKICKQAECQYVESYDGCPYGTYFAGWQKISGRGYTSGSYVQTTSDTSENYALTVKALCYYNKPPVTNNGTGETMQPQEIEKPEENVCPKSGNTEKMVNSTTYKFTYNLDGGHFIDGSTERTEIVNSKSIIGNLRLNPLKDGYKFISWQDETGKDFNFNEKPTKNINLKAKYEKLTDEEKDAYTCPKDYVLDPSNAKCYKYLKFNREGNTTSKASTDNIMQVPYQKNQNPTAGKAYNYTTYKYADGARMCYGYNSPNEGDPGVINPAQNGKRENIGKDNATYYFSEDGKTIEYDDQDTWKLVDSCNFGSKCSVDACTSIEGECEVTYSAIIFHSINATYTKKIDTTEIVEDKDNTSGENKDNKTNEDVAENPKTGTKLWIFITLGIVFSAIGVYYYHKYRKTEPKENENATLDN